MDNIAALAPHPTTPTSAVRDVSLGFHYYGTSIDLNFIVKGQIERLLVPDLTLANRADELWKTTCFEMFVKEKEGTAYREFNFSPSREWAAYDFDDYRTGMRDAVTQPPVITTRSSDEELLVMVKQPWALEHGVALAISAVIEEKGGNKSLWAINHGEGAPDFHHPSCFALELAAPGLA